MEPEYVDGFSEEALTFIHKAVQDMYELSTQETPPRDQEDPVGINQTAEDLVGTVVGTIVAFSLTSKEMIDAMIKIKDYEFLANQFQYRVLGSVLGLREDPHPLLSFDSAYKELSFTDHLIRNQDLSEFTKKNYIRLCAKIWNRAERSHNGDIPSDPYRRTDILKIYLDEIIFSLDYDGLAIPDSKSMVHDLEGIVLFMNDAAELLLQGMEGNEEKRIDGFNMAEQALNLISNIHYILPQEKVSFFLVVLAKAYLNQKNFKEAFSTVKRAIDTNGSMPEILEKEAYFVLFSSRVFIPNFSQELIEPYLKTYESKSYFNKQLTEVPETPAPAKKGPEKSKLVYQTPEPQARQKRPVLLPRKYTVFVIGTIWVIFALVIPVYYYNRNDSFWYLVLGIPVGFFVSGSIYGILIALGIVDD